MHPADVSLVISLESHPSTNLWGWRLVYKLKELLCKLHHRVLEDDRAACCRQNLVSYGASLSCTWGKTTCNHAKNSLFHRSMTAGSQVQKEYNVTIGFTRDRLGDTLAIHMISHLGWVEGLHQACSSLSSISSYWLVSRTMASCKVVYLQG